jgi:hypothetical protein
MHKGGAWGPVQSGKDVQVSNSISSWNHGKQIHARSSSKAATGARTSTMEAVATVTRAVRTRVANWENEVGT